MKKKFISCWKKIHTAEELLMHFVWEETFLYVSFLPLVLG